MMKKSIQIAALIIAPLMVLRADSSNETEKINIAVAANFSYSIKELVSEFNKVHPKIEVNVIIGSSGQLSAQIMNGAPYDLFLSADKTYPDMLFEKKLALERPVVYAKGILILFSRHPHYVTKGLKSLEDARVTTIAMPNAKIAPYGYAACQALSNQNMTAVISNKLVYAQNIAQAVQYALTVTDAGFISKSAIYAPQLEKYREEKIFWIAIDPSLYTPLEQAAVLLNNKGGSRVFYQFLFSPVAKELIRNGGYEL
jgi:molybdate transport system substrate-binding protein